MADSDDQLATVAELAMWMGVTLTGDDASRAEFIIRVASSWARSIAGKLWADRDDESFPMNVRGIIVAASRREFENPRHVTYEVKGPESASYNQLAYAPGFFNAAEEKFLKRFRPGGGLFTVGTYKDDFTTSLGYLRILGQDKPLPYFNPGDPGWWESEHL